MKLKCPECGNDKTWGDVTFNKGKYIAECYECKHVTKGEGGIEIGTVLGQMIMNM